MRVQAMWSTDEPRHWLDVQPAGIVKSGWRDVLMPNAISSGAYCLFNGDCRKNIVIAVLK